MRICIASCDYNVQAEITLEYSVRRFHPDADIRYIRNGYGAGAGWVEDNWGTRFTPFKWAIPNLYDGGRVLYLDVDTLVLAPIDNLFDMDLEGCPVASLPGNFSVALFDIEAFRRLERFYSLEELRQRSCVPAFGGIYNDYVVQLADRTKPLTTKHNCLDGDGYQPGETAIMHYTRKETQPWAPYTMWRDYLQHPDPDGVAQLWYNCHDEAMQHYRSQPTVEPGRATW